MAEPPACLPAFALSVLGASSANPEQVPAGDALICGAGSALPVQREARPRGQGFCSDEGFENTAWAHRASRFPARRGAAPRRRRSPGLYLAVTARWAWPNRAASCAPTAASLQPTAARVEPPPSPFPGLAPCRGLLESRAGPSSFSLPRASLAHSCSPVPWHTRGANAV